MGGGGGGGVCLSLHKGASRTLCAKAAILLSNDNVIELMRED